MVSSTPRTHFTPGKEPVPILQEDMWAPGPVWKGGNSRPHWNSNPDRPARSHDATPTELPGPYIYEYINVKLITNAPTCLGVSAPSSGSFDIAFASYKMLKLLKITQTVDCYMKKKFCC